MDFFIFFGVFEATNQAILSKTLRSTQGFILRLFHHRQAKCFISGSSFSHSPKGRRFKSYPRNQSNHAVRFDQLLRQTQYAPNKKIVVRAAMTSIGVKRCDNLRALDGRHYSSRLTHSETFPPQKSTTTVLPA